MNNVNIIGRLVSDPELRHTPSGTEVCQLRVAVDGAGQRQADDSFGAGFFDVTCFGKLAANCAQYLGKGKRVGVSGRLQFEEWEKDGQRRSKVSVTAMGVDFLTPAGESNGAGSGQAAPTSSAADDDIPF